MTSPAAVKAAAERFELPGTFVDAAPHGNGHINRTFAARFDQGGVPVRYVLQRLNDHVFTEPQRLMANMVQVTGHIRKKLERAGIRDVDRRVLTLVKTWTGEDWHMDDEGGVWRCCRFVEGARTRETCTDPAQAFQAAKAFGTFQRLLLDYEGPPLFETIPRFHHTRSRFDAFRAALAADRCNRAAQARAEIAFAWAREDLADSLLALQATGALPQRITHNDTKLNNVLLDEATGEGLCVLDLDTVMPGLSLYDFGDLVRAAANPAAEDERDLREVRVAVPVFEALAQGYLDGTGDALLPVEREHMVVAGKLLALELGVRFLTDFLEGDGYFGIRREAQNLDRCRVQFAFLRALEGCEERLSAFIRRLA